MAYAIPALLLSPGLNSLSDVPLLSFTVSVATAFVVSPWCPQQAQRGSLCSRLARGIIPYVCMVNHMGYRICTCLRLVTVVCMFEVETGGTHALTIEVALSEDCSQRRTCSLSLCVTNGPAWSNASRQPMPM